MDISCRLVRKHCRGQSSGIGISANGMPKDGNIPACSVRQMTRAGTRGFCHATEGYPDDVVDDENAISNGVHEPLHGFARRCQKTGSLLPGTARGTACTMQGPASKSTRRSSNPINRSDDELAK